MKHKGIIITLDPRVAQTGLHHAGVTSFIKLSRVKEEVLFDSVTLAEFDESFQVVNLKGRIHFMLTLIFNRA